jgi:hypothetical protein
MSCIYINTVTGAITDDWHVAEPWMVDAEYHRNWSVMADVEELAAFVTEKNADGTGSTYIATDAGEHAASHRFGVVRMPEVGDLVSYGFNGDCYPCGKIERISPTGSRITTDTGTRFTRQKLSGSWRSGGTWWMRKGHVTAYNLSF